MSLGTRGAYGGTRLRESLPYDRHRALVGFKDEERVLALRRLTVEAEAKLNGWPNVLITLILFGVVFVQRGERGYRLCCSSAGGLMRLSRRLFGGAVRHRSGALGASHWR